MEFLPPEKVKVLDVKGKGRGVFATQDILAGETIEICPTIFLSEKEVSFLEKEADVLKFYYLIQTSIKKCCIMLGYGFLYNHSLNPNADIDYNEEKAEKWVYFKAIKDIKKGEEIVFDYEFDDNKEEFLDLN